eukprot:TRINITY_DN12780_c0_g1_i1.p1 TRINITY_DN12780_c0_g1~~TRINITY_DN12780_c0_g1_i1.p1  ORF type:complete len:298 (-),score=53.22 TRINITY_DN12780_c0_g1_i1:59-952(-)
MGCTQSSVGKAPSKRGLHIIGDHFRCLEDVQEGLRKAGLESSNLIIGVDFTKSNLTNGAKTFMGRSLHYFDPSGSIQNPYEQVIDVVGRTLEPFDDDKLIPTFGFGDVTTADRAVFPFYDGRICYTFKEVLQRYRELVPNIQLSGPTSFAPVINAAVDIVQRTGQYHILVIIADGQVVQVKQTEDAIVRASNFPLSIIMVGVGDGPWDMMKEFDDGLPARVFDNFQFVNFHEVVEKAEGLPDVVFATNALMEIPEQFAEIRRLGLLNRVALAGPPVPVIDPHLSTTRQQSPRYNTAV